MRPSTAAELGGFGLIAFATYRWNATLGLVVGGVFLLLIGYVFEDDVALVSLVRMVSPLKIRWESLKARTHDWRSDRQERRQQPRWRRPPAEVLVRVKGD